MIDVSDGLGRDAGRVGAASGVRVVIEGGRVPRHVGVEDVRRAVSEGEDYELLCTVSGDTELPAATPGGTSLTCIGRVEAGGGCVLVIDGQEHDAESMGWDHE
jgi:thiamine-monophosphate kinase